MVVGCVMSVTVVEFTFFEFIAWHGVFKQNIPEHSHSFDLDAVSFYNIAKTRLLYKQNKIKIKAKINFNKKRTNY